MMESLSEFAIEMQKGDQFIYMDIQKGYRHFRLHPPMRDWFVFRYAGKYYQYVALPFDCGRSLLWFTMLMAILVGQVRRLGCLTVAYLDDFLILPSSPGVVSTKAHCAAAAARDDKFMKSLGLKTHPSTRVWIGKTVIEDLRVKVDSVEMKFFIAERKVRKIMQLSKDLLRDVRAGRGWVPAKKLTHFYGVCVSLTLAMPWARFYARSLYWDMAAGRSRDERGRVRVSHQSIRDLRKWRDLPRQELSGRPVVPPPPQAAIHSDAADMGYGCTLHFDNLEQGIGGQWHAQGIWEWRYRAHSISYRELKAIRKLLMGHLGHKLEQESVQNLLLHVDNHAVVHITNALVSASRPMMRELRKLKLCLDRLGLQIQSEWIPSFANRFANGLSRRFPRGDLQIRRQLRHSVVAVMKAPIEVFKQRPLGDPPVFGRRQAFDELQRPLDKSEVRLLCPPVDLITVTLQKLEVSRAPAMLLIPDWPRQGWYWRECRIASKVTPLDQAAPDMEAYRQVNRKWRLLLLEVNFA